MLSASLPSLKPEVPAVELCHLDLGLAVSLEGTLMVSRWVALDRVPVSGVEGVLPVLDMI